MLRALVLVACLQSTLFHVQAELDTFSVPAFEYQSLTSVSPNLLTALQQDGIIALRNIPQYAELRSAYLQAATECALTGANSRLDNAAFVQSKTLQDGTRRFTITSTAGKELPRAAQDTLALCPEYVATYRTFSALIESVVDTVGQSLDASHTFSVPSHPEVSGSELLSNSVHLDHFHAYQAATTPNPEDLSLEMHVDNGMMIAMTAPLYFDVHAVSKELTLSQDGEYQSGLLIERRDGKLVRPVLKQEELVLMVGAGFQEWVRTTPPLRPVPHGMKFPTLATNPSNVVRAWFGKMVLLAPEQRMLNTGMVFKDYVTQTTRYLKTAVEDRDHAAFSAIACPKNHRRLHSSDGACIVKTCYAKAGKNPQVPCSIQCNLEEKSRPGAERLCQENCECDEKSSNSTTPATYCWMLCSPKLPEGQCDSQGQRCVTSGEAPYLDEQKYVCASTAGNNKYRANNTIQTPGGTPAVPAQGSSANTILFHTAALVVSLVIVGFV